MRPAERRTSERRDYARPCKIGRHGASRRTAGRTINLSTSGALIETFDSPACEPGSMVELGILWGKGAVLRRSMTIASRVVRCEPTSDGLHRIAVVFLEPAANLSEADQTFILHDSIDDARAA